MQANSRAVSSNQRFVHPKLSQVVRRHLQQPSRKPIARHNREAFAALAQRMADEPRPLVLDSFCGTGQSTAALAGRHPGHLVVGIDKSAHRLQRHVGSGAGNYLLLRAECEDIWQLVAARRWIVDYHYILYPNPWPKAAHLQRRVHGHASFPLLLQLGGRIELRSNWQLYAEEFGVALSLAGRRGRIGRRPMEPTPLTLFERKYQSSGQSLWYYESDDENARPAP
ncbi:tRNA (guanine(46)-N(7))-methyltransferase TrmB [Parahaliea mediterranea]|uniref:tRNA (guanine(46)-N(7))-methyltransferase n=1 Tax=Parahaliea mediterranea TaxID=651086 RepID=A0A939DGR8_9GAMM|nr:SAM-dependent methyltransferase [Parahaliea mediterranea]MBN7797886.1 SAM-dependent methyltransferase [Parahaliea mediterranea]